MKPLVIIKQAAISSLGSLLSDGTTFERVRATVERVEDPNLSGAEKKQAVLAELKVIGLDLANWLANILIALAVSYIRVAVQK